MDEDHWDADEREYQRWLRAEGEDLIRFIAQQKSLMSEEDRKAYIETERLSKEILEDFQTGLRQPEKKKR